MNYYENTRLLLFITICLVLRSCLYAAEGGYTIDKLNTQRKEVAHRERRLIMNNDGTDFFAASKILPFSVDNFLKQRCFGLEGTHVDSIFYNTGVPFKYTHQSSITEIMTIRDAEAERQFKQYTEYLKVIHSTDSLQIMIDFARKNNIEVFWSMRMNDSHDSNLTGSFSLISIWKNEHPECLVGEYGDRFPYGHNRWSSLNYDMPEVREKVYRTLYDVCSRYQIDGIELDFFRHPVLFKSQMTGEPVTNSQRDKLSALMRRIRDMTTHLGIQRERPFLVAIRVPDSVDYCNALGIDLLKWLEEDLIDIVIGGDYFKLEPWENLVSLGKKYDVPVYACLEARRIEKVRHPEGDSNLPVWRGEALNAWKAGVDGIYTFNRFDPEDRIFREIGDPKLLKNLEYIDQTVYVNPNLWSRPEVWLKDGDTYVLEEVRDN